MTATFKFRFRSCFLFQVQSRWWWHLQHFSSEYCFFKLFQALTNSTTPTDALQQNLPLRPATEAQAKAKSRLANLVSPLEQTACSSDLTSSNALSDLNRILFVHATSPFLLMETWILHLSHVLVSATAFGHRRGFDFSPTSSFFALFIVVPIPRVVARCIWGAAVAKDGLPSPSHEPLKRLCPQ